MFEELSVGMEASPGAWRLNIFLEGGLVLTHLEYYDVPALYGLSYGVELG
jgi:hypothetical protein